MNKKNKILFAAAECAPFAKVGGLADVTGSLPKALKELGSDISVILPYYGKISIDKKDRRVIKKGLSVKFNKKDIKFNIWESRLPKSDVPILLIDNKRYFSGEPYSTEKVDEATRFLFFSQAVVKTVRLLKFQIIHCHDWHTSMIPFLLRNSKAKTIFTIHNIAYQGVFDADKVNSLLGTKFKGTVNCMREGIENADAVTTVSPNYAKEILTPKFGFGLEGILKERKKDLFGIINGIDPEQFNPKTDEMIVERYSLDTVEKKAVNKRYLQEDCFGKSNKSIPIIGMVTRIADQKGFDLIEEILPKMMKEKLQLVILGKGMKKYEDVIKTFVKKHPNKIFVKTKFDEEFAHRIYAGSDIFLMPSHFEPCGLGQMIAMTYGSLPIVRGVGGLKDTVIPVEKKKATGFVFNENSPEALWTEIKKALRLFKDKNLWSDIQKNGMMKDFSWKRSALRYIKLYDKVN